MEKQETGLVWFWRHYVEPLEVFILMVVVAVLVCFGIDVNNRLSWLEFQNQDTAWEQSITREIINLKYDALLRKSNSAEELLELLQEEQERGLCGLEPLATLVKKELHEKEAKEEEGAVSRPASHANPSVKGEVRSEHR